MFKIFNNKSTNLTRSVQTVNKSAHCNQKNMSFFIAYNRQFQILASPKTIKFPPNGCFEKDDFTLALAGGFLNCSGRIELKHTGGDLMQLSILCVQLYRLVRKEKWSPRPFVLLSIWHSFKYLCVLAELFTFLTTSGCQELCAARCTFCLPLIHDAVVLLFLLTSGVKKHP